MARVAELLAEAALDGDEARREAELLLCRALDKPRSYLFAWPEAEVDELPASIYRSWVGERRRGVPVAHLLGEREFWSLTLAVTGATLIPRPDTEILVEWALELPLPDDAKVVDLGTGSGAIALALASERPDWRVTATDSSPEALLVARANGARCGLDGVRFAEGSWFDGLGDETFDLVLSNPPYVAAGDRCLVTGDLRFEPRTALVADDNGYADLAAIIAAAPQHLQANGYLLLEHGNGQGAGVRARLEAAGFAAVSTRRDLAGHERVSAGRWSGGG
ncbi:MAG: peptide chain release factor N(5)-glutamine methyltransferase [Halieaceae bacterium]|jgi:release factor glutamine methyltransferase|nr:peptide chain release factor N(5)-glutamine methyltransferase [Halieaceae bacterium]